MTVPGTPLPWADRRRCDLLGPPWLCQAPLTTSYRSSTFSTHQRSVSFQHRSSGWSIVKCIPPAKTTLAGWPSPFLWVYQLYRMSQKYFWLPCSPISPHVQGGCSRSSAKIFFSFSAYLWKQNLFRMLTGCQKDRKTGWKTDGQTDRQIDRQIFPA